LRLCQKAGLVSLGHVALDDTKVQANASKHKAMSNGRMLKSERQLEGEMRALLRKAELIDAQEDGQYGKGKRGDELPEGLQRRSSRLEWIRKAKAELEAEAAAAKARQRDEQAEAVEQEAEVAEASGDEQRSKRAVRRSRGARKRADDTQKLAIEKATAAGLEPSTVASAADTDPQAMPQRTLPTNAAGNPKPSAQRNFTDPDSHILKGGEGWIQGYNCQAAVDGDHQVIVAIGVSNQASDAVHLLPMLERTLANTGQQPDVLIADAGYCSAANLEARKLNAYISTSRQQHGHRPKPSRGRIPRDLDARGRMDRKLRSKAGQAVYALRKTVVEPVFGQIKGARGLDRFRLRGLEKVNEEWALMATTHNILKLFRTTVAMA
jgi:hypothetical protein